MTRIDRYILLLFLRTAAICFCSLSGIFVVFHAFTSMDDLLGRAQQGEGLVVVMAKFYGPYLLMLFDSTGTIITLMSLLFTAGWLRRTGELTAMLSTGVPHGRIFRPMLVASVMIVTVQIANREYYLPQFAHEMSIKAKPGDGPLSQPILAQYDKLNRVLIDGDELIAAEGRISGVNLRLDGDMPGFGDSVIGRTAHWRAATSDRPSGYLIENVTRPEDIDDIPAVRFGKRLVFVTHHDSPGLKSGQCFFATTVHCDLLQSNESARKLASLSSLMARVANPAVHSSAALRVLLHSRLVRPPLDIALICLVLPLAVNLKGRNLFLMAAVALGTVVLFFAIKMVASAMGGGGYLISPITAGWLPLLILGPIAYYRYRLVQIV